MLGGPDVHFAFAFATASRSPDGVGMEHAAMCALEPVLIARLRHNLIPYYRWIVSSVSRVCTALARDVVVIIG